MVALGALVLTLVSQAPTQTYAAASGVPNVLGATEAPDIDDQLRRAKNEYAYGHYAQAIEQLNALLYPMRLSTDDQVIEARKYLGLCYYLTGKVTAASEEFKKLLYLSPDYELDPYAIAPPVIELFELTRDKHKPELDAIRQRKTDEQIKKPAGQGVKRTITERSLERSDFATFMPFGVGQFQNGDIGWGAFFAATELVLLAANIGAYLWAASYGPTYYDDRDDVRRRVQALTVAQYAAAGLLGVTWSLGVFHARLNFEPTLELPRSVKDEPLTSFGPPSPLPSSPVAGGTVSFTLRF